MNVMHERALRLDRDYALGWYNKGNLHRNLSEHAEAVECYKEALQRNSRMAWALCNMGLSLIEVGRYGEAARSLRRGHRLGSARGSDWPYASPEWLQNAEALAKQEDRLVAIAAGSQEPDHATAPRHHGGDRSFRSR